MNVPNALTLLRFALVPVIAVEIRRGAFGVAFVLFFVIEIPAARLYHRAGLRDQPY